MSFVDAVAPAERWAFARFARAGFYRKNDPPGADVGLKAFVRGLRSEDTFASAIQQDVVGIVDAQAFVAAVGAATPRRFDRLVMGNRVYAVEEWRGAPNDDAPVFFKLLLRGSFQ